MLEFKRLWIGLVLIALAAAPAAGQAREQREPGLNDNWITTKIQASYFLDEDVKSRNIDVRTVNGIVTLTGVVANEQERQQALQIARTVDGVKQVVDRLRVGGIQEGGAEPGAGRQPGGQRPGAAELEQLTESDAALLTQVKTKLALDAEVSALNIDVDVDEGVVTLSGTVDSEASRQRAIALAREVEGVRDVRDNLRVQAR